MFGAGALHPHNLADRADHLIEAGCLTLLGTAGGRQNAVTQMIVEHTYRHHLQGPDGRADLDHHIGTPAVGLDHLLQAAVLALDLAQLPQVILLAGGITALRPARPGTGRRVALAGLQAISAGGDGRHRQLLLPTGLRSSPDASTSRSRRYSSASISPRAKRWSRICRASTSW